jgi:hypothetical protein
MDFAGQLSKSLQDSQGGLGSPSTSRLEVTKPNRRPSKSISSARPILNLNKRTKSYHHESPHTSSAGAGPSSPSPNLLPLSITPGRNVMKRRTSTPSLAKQYLPEDDELQLPPSELETTSASPSTKGKEKAVESRARSTSTSFVHPPSALLPSATVAVNKRSPSPFRGTISIPPPQWAGLQVTPASPEEMEESWRPEPIVPKPSFLTKAKELGETSLNRFTQWVKPSKSKRRRVERRRISEDDSEKGMSEDGGDPAESLESVGTTRTSMDSFRAGRGKFWGFSDEEEDPGYFSLPPTPPEEKDSIPLELSGFGQTSLPTPALSTRSLSKPRTGRRELHTRQENSSRGWLRHLLSYGSGTKTGQVIRELGWTVGLLAALFLVTGGVALYLIKGMPM